jgi:hypothetical protein
MLSKSTRIMSLMERSVLEVEPVRLGFLHSRGQFKCQKRAEASYANEGCLGLIVDGMARTDVRFNIGLGMRKRNARRPLPGHEAKNKDEYKRGADGQGEEGAPPTGGREHHDGRGKNGVGFSMYAQQQCDGSSSVRLRASIGGVLRERSTL